MLEYNVSKISFKNYFTSFYKVGDWSIFVEKNVGIQKHKYTPKLIQLILIFYES
jgi:hypothetical protein